MSKARQFVYNYWFDHFGTPNCKLSKSVTTILGYFENGKITQTGRVAYKKLISNL